MRQFFIDELSPQDVSAVKEFLKANVIQSSYEDLFWVQLSRDLLDPEQFECEADQPFCFAIEVGDSWVKFEFLIRSRTNFKSAHLRYATRKQQDFILDYAARMIKELDLKT
ncbi:MAG: hypothetical protein JRJ73_06090 [Deltaproteobacteria bacterium]|nr:hypothetical protein [Deltaproteobacteria bacterium]